MKVLKVIVDEVPESCFLCRGAVRKDKDYNCGVVLRELSRNDFKKRPDWCPLVVEKKYKCALCHLREYAYKEIKESED